MIRKMECSFYDQGFYNNHLPCTQHLILTTLYGHQAHSHAQGAFKSLINFSQTIGFSIHNGGAISKWSLNQQLELLVSSMDVFPGGTTVFSKSIFGALQEAGHQTSPSP